MKVKLYIEEKLAFDTGDISGFPLLNSLQKCEKIAKENFKQNLKTEMILEHSDGFKFSVKIISHEK